MFWLYTSFADCFLCKYFQWVFITLFVCFLLKLKRLQQSSQSTHLLYVYSSCKSNAIALHLWWQISGLHLWCVALGITARSRGAVYFSTVTHKTHAAFCLLHEYWSLQVKVDVSGRQSHIQGKFRAIVTFCLVQFFLLKKKQKTLFVLV